MGGGGDLVSTTPMDVSVCGKVKDMGPFLGVEWGSCVCRYSLKLEKSPASLYIILV